MIPFRRHLKVILRITTMKTVIGQLPTHSWTLPNSISIDCQVLSKILDTPPIFDWQVSLAYATTFLSILLLQYIFKLIPCSELSFRGPNLGPHQKIYYSPRRSSSWVHTNQTKSQMLNLLGISNSQGKASLNFQKTAS